MARIGYNDHVDRSSRRRLRSASVQLGTLTALALVLSGCNTGPDDDDDDCALGPTDGSVVAMAFASPAIASSTVANGRTSGDQPPGAGAALPEQGGFGTHLAACGG